MAEERDLRTVQIALQAKLDEAHDEIVHESDLREVLLAELDERLSYSSELCQRMLDAEESRGIAAADVTNLRSDIGQLVPEMRWAERYHEGVAAHRSKLEAEVLEAERSLLDRRRDLRAVGVAAHLA